MVSAVRSLTVREDEAGMRLDRWFRTHFPAIRHGELEKLLRTGQIRVGGGRAKANRRLETGDEVRIPPLRENLEPPARERGPADPADARFLREITIYEDASIIALNKPFGLAVQGGEKTTRHIDGMLAALASGEERPRLVHRLDRDTGGLLLVAKTRGSAARLGASFQRHEVAKTYWALVAGAPRPRRGTIDLPVGKTGKAGQERVEPGEGEGAKNAITDYQIVEEAGQTAAFVALRPRTGRTHQLRVHCSALGASIVGDRKYGGAAARIPGVAARLHLFCREMTFPHPESGRPLSLRAPLHGHMLETWQFFHFDPEAAVEWPEIE